MTVAVTWLMSGLASIGRHAQWVLLAGICLCFFVPDVSGALRPVLPLLVPLVLGLGIARVDPGPLLGALRRPAHLVKLLLAVILLMPVCGVLYFWFAQLAGLSAGMSAALVYLAAAPPIASAGALCFILGYNPRIAIELTLTATLLTPLLGPLTVALCLTNTPDFLWVDLGVRLLGMVLAACLFALAFRRLAGADRIRRSAAEMDGLGVIVLVVFVLSLFDGVPAMLLEEPGRAFRVLILAFTLNIGVALLLRQLARLHLNAADSGALGIVSGNRTIAIYIAALPFDAELTLFVALYQVPMLLTPLILGKLRA